MADVTTTNINEEGNQSQATAKLDVTNEDPPFMVNEVETGGTDEATETIEKNEEVPYSERCFQIGDHVYKWCSFAGIPGLFQHHGIITEINGDMLFIADFSGVIRGEDDQRKCLFVNRTTRGGMRVCEKEDSNEWRKVEYSASWWKRNLWRSGTCTAVESDPPGLVLSRVAFLLAHPDKLPKYHFLKANCECVAVWCKTGTWATLQASTFLHVTAAGQAKSATTLALYAASQQVTVPASGFWGYLGYTTKVSLLSTQPYILPVIAGYGIITIGGPFWMLHRCKKFWHETSQRLRNDFWENAIDQPEVFVECITEWSQL
ncbi:hypothetical protein MHU86_14006 [Fragilaria crotonensis]|nr:hypothetical protein MHU86_14006 [Fragilaria crotonensis]